MFSQSAYKYPRVWLCQEPGNCGPLSPFSFACFRRQLRPRFLFFLCASTDRRLASLPCRNRLSELLLPRLVFISIFALSPPLAISFASAIAIVFATPNNFPRHCFTYRRQPSFLCVAISSRQHLKFSLASLPVYSRSRVLASWERGL